MRCSWLIALLLAGCNEQVCIRHSECPAGETCSAQGVCKIAPSDGGVDAGDAAEPDAPSDADAGVDAGLDAQMDDAAVDGGS
jgi:hypothetical protein